MCAKSSEATINKTYLVNVIDLIENCLKLLF